MNIVLDTNCLLMCIGKSSHYRKIWLDFIRAKYNLCVSNEIIYEYEEILERFTSSDTAEMIVEFILAQENTILCDPHISLNLITADPDDNKFVDCAITTNATYIVSNDRHFDILKKIPFPKINVIKIDSFLKILKEEIPQNRAFS
jgi:putative PIN family toxin of toxin-antitoxin system